MGCNCTEMTRPNRRNKSNNKSEEADTSVLNEDKKIDNNLSEEKMKQLLDSLEKVYYSAKTYFYSNDFKEKEVDAIRKCEQISLAKEKLKNGQYKEIDVKKFPKEITPEYINGYKKEERKEKIEFIINKLKQEREDVIKRKNQKLEELKKESKNVNKNDIKQFKDYAKNILENEENKIKELNKQINEMNNIINEEYIPVPDYIIENEEYKVEKVNENIPDNTLKINVSNLSYTKSNPIIILNLKSDDNIIRTNEIKGKTNNDINNSFDWLFTEKEYKNLLRNKIEIILQRAYMFKSNKIKGISEISLKELKSCDTAGGIVKLKMASGKSDQNIDVTINIRSAIIDKEYETAYREVLKIKKIYPKFDIDGDNYIARNNQFIKLSINQILNEINDINDKKIETSLNENIEIKKENNIINNNSNNNGCEIEKEDTLKINKKINPNNKINNINKKKEPAKNVNNINNIKGQANNDAKIDKNLFKEEELNDVDIIDNLNSLKVLNDRLKNLEIMIAKIDGRTPRELLQKKIKINVKIKNLENQMNEGELEPKDYLLLMEHQLKHDVLLCKYLKQENEMEKAKNVYKRIELLNQEINELKQFMK